MSESIPGRWARIGAALTRTRLFISNLIFFAALLFAALLLFSGERSIKIPQGGALIIDPIGSIVEHGSIVNPLERWLSPTAAGAETEIESILDAIDRARTDDRIHLIVLDFDQLEAIGTAHADAIGEALATFRAAGKQVIAYGSSYTQQAYLMASAADAVYMHPLGQLLLPGYHIENLYFQELLERLHVDIEVFRAGKYKEFVEPYTRSDMSPEAREVNAALLTGLWDRYSEKVILRRHLDRDRFERYTQFLDQALAETGGDLARLAVEYHLVDELLTPDQARVRIGDEVGYDDDGDYRGVALADYLQAIGPRQQPDDADGEIGVITAEGPVVMSGTFDSVIAADSLTDLIRSVRKDDSIKALVLRLDTPGGSSFASELIRQELELVQLAGKPVVVSMGPVAASGGYWISATADTIVAEPTTLTGSIGVFGIFPSFKDSLESLGVRADGVGTSSMGDLNPLSGLSNTTRQVLQASTENIYQRFVNLVARGRDLAPEKVEELAQGRVWLGSTAMEQGLVDQLGDRQAAIVRAAELAKLDTYAVREITPPVSAGELLLERLSNTLSAPGLAWVRHSALGPLARHLEADSRVLATLTDPQHQYALCGQCAAAGGGMFGPW